MALLLRVGAFFFILDFVRVAANFRFGSSIRNQLPRAEEDGEKPLIAIACVVSFVRGREFRMAHAATIHVTNTRRTAASLRGPCLITFPPRAFNSLANRLVASTRAPTGGVICRSHGFSFPFHLLFL